MACHKFTIVLKEGTDIYWARQQINQRVQENSVDIARSGFSDDVASFNRFGRNLSMGAQSRNPMQKKPDGTAYSAMDLREIQDWIVRPQLQRVQGVAEVNSIGGFNKTYVVSPDLNRMQQLQPVIRTITASAYGK